MPDDISFKNLFWHSNTSNCKMRALKTILIKTFKIDDDNNKTKNFLSKF